MKRELGIGRCGLACCLCSENDKCTDVIQVIVRTRNGVKTESVPLQKAWIIVMTVMKIAERV